MGRFAAQRPNCSLTIAGGLFQRPSVFLLPPVQRRGDVVTLTCYVKDFYPEQIEVSWLIDDKPAEAGTFSTTTPVENNGSYSVYGQLLLSRDDWEDNDVAYNCVVYHKSILDTPGVVMRSIAQRSGQNVNLVNLDVNVPKTCQ